MYSTEKKTHHPVAELEQPNRQIHEKASHQRKEQGQTTMWRYALEMNAPMLMRQAMHKLIPTNAQVSEADGIQQVQHKEEYVQLQPIIENQLH